MPLPPHLKQKYSLEKQKATVSSPSFAQDPKPDLDTAYTRMLEKLTPEVEESFRYVQPERLRKTMREISEMDELPRRQEMQRLQRSVRTSRDFVKAARKLSVMAEREGRPDLAKKIREAQQKALRGEQSPMEMMLAGGSLLFKGLDYPHKKLIRSWTTPERKGDKPGKDVGAAEWAKRIREEAEKGSVLPRIIVGLADVPGSVFGGMIGAGVATAGAAVDVATGRKVDPSNVWKTIRETQKDTGDFILTAATDPLSYLTAGGGSSAKNAMSATSRALKPIAKAKGLKASQVDDIVQGVGKIASEKAGTPEAFDDVIRLFGDADIPRSEVQKIFGAQGEFFGRGQLRYGAPFIEKAGIELPQITGKEYAIGKALQKGYRKAVKEPIESITGSKLRELYDPTKGTVKRIQRETRGEVSKLEKQLLDEYEAISRQAPSKARREWIVRNVIDPYRPEAGGQGLSKINRDALFTKAGKPRRLSKMPEDQMPEALRDYWSPFKKRITDIAAGPLSKKDQRAAKKAILDEAHEGLDPNLLVPRDTSLLQGLTANEVKWVNDLDGLFRKIHNEGVARGYIGRNRIAWNKWTGRYFPRQYSRDWGVLDELPESLRSYDPTKIRGRKGQGVELGKTADDVRAEMPDELNRIAEEVGGQKNMFRAETDKVFDDVFDAGIQRMRTQNEEAIAKGIDPATLPSPERIVNAKKLLEDSVLQRTRVKGEADPNLAVPQYIQRFARGTGEKKVEDAIAAAFGVPKTSKMQTGAFGDFDELGDTGVAIPRDIHRLMRGTFDSTHQSFRSFMSRVPGGKSPAARAVMKGLDAYARLTNFWKRNVLVTRPGYHMLNAYNDSLQMVTDGMMRPGKWLWKAQKVYRGKEGLDVKVVVDGKTVTKSYTPQQIKELAQKYNLPVQDISSTSIARLEQVGPTAGQYRRFQRATQKQRVDAKKAVKKKHGRLKGEELEMRIAEEMGSTPLAAKEARAEDFDRIVRGGFDTAKEYVGMPGLPAKTGEWVAKQWEGHAKMAHFMWRLSKGDSPAIAASRTFDILLDYQNPGKYVQIARWFFPFATWMMTAPKMTARLATTRPGAVANVERFFRAQEGEGAEPGSYVSQRAPFYHLEEPGKQLLGGAREAIRRGIAPLTGEDPDAIAGTGVGPGMSAVHMPREPFGESLTMPLEASGVSSLLQGRGWDPKIELLAGSAAPLPKAMAEYLFQKDVVTGKPLQRSAPWELFPSRMPAVPEFLRSKPGGIVKGQKAGEMPWLSKDVLPMVMSPAGIALANLGLYRAGGGEEGGAPLSTIGRIRQYAPPGEAGNIYAQQILNMLTGMPMYSVSPMDRPYEDSRRLRDMQEGMRRAKLEAEAMQRARER